MSGAKRLISFALPYRRWLLLAFVLIMFTSLAINFLPVLLQRITDECLLDGGTPVEGRTALMMRLGILYISIAAVGHLVKIEVEVDTLAQLDEALAAGAKIDIEVVAVGE